MRASAWLALMVAWCAAGLHAATPGAFELKAGDRVVFVGDAFIEAEQRDGWIELMLTTRFADRGVTFRNLGWNGDTPDGESRLGLSLLQAGKEPPGEGWRQLVQQITNAQPTVAFVGYGMASSFAGEPGLATFRAGTAKLLDAIASAAPGVRIVVIGPIRHEALGAPWPEPAAHNAQIGLYDAVLRELAAQRSLPFVSLFEALANSRAPKLTENGVLLNAAGYRVAAEIIEEKLFGAAGAWRESANLEPLRQAILRKNQAFFHRSRPANMAYIFGFRKAEQGRNAAEVAQFDATIAAEEERIAKLRGLRAVDVPATPQRTGNLAARHTPQPHPEFEVADGLEVTLWAENPLLHKPVQMNFDARGRLWIASSEVYPQIEPGQAPTDKIIVLEDTTGGGRADKATVFADGLLIPTGVVPGDGGCYVAQSTELLHFADTDGDGKADARRVVLSGFGTEDTHHNLHTLHWGPDGRMYLNQSVYTRTNTETPHGVVRLKAGGIFRFDPRDQRMEILFRGWVNAWGHQFDAFGQSFVTDGAGPYGISWGVPGATYFTLAPARRVLQSASPGSYPKFCGLEIIRSALFPADWQGDAVTCDFRAHRIVRFTFSDQGAGYVTRERPDLLRTTADSFRPIDAKLGPDGALYIADWSNPIIQHGEVDFRDPRRDKEHGRIWRIAPKGRAPLPHGDLTRIETGALLEKLVSPNGYEQEQAQRVLIERGAAAVRPALEAWTQRQATAAALLRALWLNQAFNYATPELSARLLADADARIRAAAVRALPENVSLETLAPLVADAHSRVRLEAVRALGRQDSLRAAELALSVLERPMDPFLDCALWLTMNELAAPWIAAVKDGAWTAAGRERQLEFTLKAIEPALASEVLGQLLGERPLPRDGSGPWLELIAAAGGPPELGRVFAQVARGEFTGAAQVRALNALAEAARLRNAKPAGDLAALGPMLSSADEPVRVAALQLAAAWKAPRFVPALLAAAAKANATPGERATAFAALREIGGVEAIAGLQKLARETSAPEIRREAVVALAALDLPAALPEVMAVLNATTTPAEAEALWRALLRIRGAGTRLAAEISRAPVPRDVALAGLRPAREGTQNQALVAPLLQAAGLSLTAAPLSAADLVRLGQEALAKGDAARGERVYRRPELACVACHAIGGVGGKVGPDLTSIGASAPVDYLVESLVYPGAKIKEGYHSLLVTKKNGQEFSGLVIREDAAQLVLRDTTNREISIAAQDIAKRTDVGSLMPAGLIDQLVPDERLDLIKFLGALGKPGDFDASKGGVARAWKLYLVTSQNEPFGVERVVAGDFQLRDWVPLFALANGALAKDVVAASFPSLANNRGFFAATRFQSSNGGPVTLEISGKVRAAWLNGRPVKRGDGPLRVEAKTGSNTLVLQLDEPVENLKVSASEVTFASSL